MTHSSVSSLRLYKCPLLVWKLKQNIHFQEGILDPKDIDGTFF